MAREVMTRRALAEWMTEQLRRVEDCEQCTVGEVTLLQQPDTDGCNWSSSLVVRSGEVPTEHFSSHLTNIVAQARTKFNVV
jgi:hypothetical protein